MFYEDFEGISYDPETTRKIDLKNQEAKKLREEERRKKREEELRKKGEEEGIHTPKTLTIMLIL